MYLVPTYARETVKAACQKRVEKPSEGTLAGRPGGMAQGDMESLAPLLHRGRSRDPPLSEPAIQVAVAPLSMTKEEGSSLCHPQRLVAGEGVALPSSLPVAPSWVSLLPLLGRASPGGRDTRLCHCPSGSRVKCSLMGYLLENLRSKEEQG